LAAQAAYYLITAVWPFAHLHSFLAVTGPKREVWLLKTVSALVGVIGTALGLAAARGRATSETDVLAVGSALSLASVDVVYVARRRISPVYLADAALQLACVAGWAGSRRAARRAGSARPSGG
jgi:hypothetical protein